VALLVPNLAGSAVAQPLDRPAANPPNVRGVVLGNNTFAFDLYAQLRRGQRGDFFFSPINLSTSLSMVSVGARGPTEAEMVKVLHLPPDRDRRLAEFQAMLSELGHEQDQPGYRLRLANRLWGQRGYPFLVHFLNATSLNYGAPLGLVDFGVPEVAREEINSWVGEKTEGLIKDLIPAGGLGPDTRLVLTNAIAFKGEWAYPFKPEKTEKAPFITADAREVIVPLMFQEQHFRFGFQKTFMALEMNYANGRASAVFLLPQDRNGLPALEDALSAENLEAWRADMIEQPVQVYLPRFRVTTRLELARELQALGMGLAFGKEADFTGMSRRGDLFLSEVFHQAFVEVDERGTRAAAGAGSKVSARSFPPVFRADHPFIFLIRDSRTGAITFVGRIVDPQP